MTDRLRRTIFVGCRELGLDDEARHDMQMSVTGKASLSDMTEAELQLVVDNLKTKGFQVQGGEQRKRAGRADLRLIHVLWRKLGEAGALEKPGRAGLNAFIRRRFGDVWFSVPADVDMLREHDQIEMVITALKAWGERANIDFDWSQHRR